MRVAIRADASSQIGTGHVSRCLALGESLLDLGHQVVLFTADHEIPWLKARIIDSGISVEAVRFDSLESAQFKEFDPDFIILDSYNFLPTDTKRIYSNYKTLTLIDDFKTEYFSHLYLNQNLGSDSQIIKSPVKGIDLLGPKFALIRKNLLEARNAFRIDHREKVQLICLTGGSSSNNAILMVSQFLTRHKNISEVVFIGANKMQTEIREVLPKWNLSFIDFSPNLHSYLASATAVISAAGSSVLELSAIGIPTGYFPIAENQLPYLDYISLSGSGLVLVDRLDTEIDGTLDFRFQQLLFDGATRATYFKNSRTLVDGMGARRVITGMIEFSENQR